MIMCWQGLFRVLLIYSLVQASCSKETASSRREDIGIIVGTPLIALAEAQGDKNEKGQVHLKETGSIINSDKLQYIAPTGAKNNIFQKNNHSYLPFLNSKLMKDMNKSTPYYSFNRSFANVHREQNEARDVNDIVAPSQFTEKVYSELEGKEPKAPGFQVEKEGFSDPWDHGMPTENLSNSTSITNSSKSLPLETLEKAKNAYFDEEFANDPLATNMDPMTSKKTPNIRIISTVISASRNVSSSNTLQSAKDTALEEKTMNEPLVTPVDHMASKENKNIGISTVMTASKNVSSLKTLQNSKDAALEEKILKDPLVTPMDHMGSKKNQNMRINTLMTASKNVSPSKTLQYAKDAAFEENILNDTLATFVEPMGTKENKNVGINSVMTASKNVSPSETSENATEAAFQGTILIEPLAVPVDHMTSKNVQNVGINTFMTPSQNVFPSETVQTDEPEFGEKILNDPLTTSIDHMAFKNAQNIGINTLVTASKNVSPSERVQKAEEADFGEKILNDPLTIPVDHMTSKENKTIGINTVTSSFKNVPSKALQNAKNPTLDENKLKDPLENQNIEVSTDMSSSRNVSPSKTLQNAEEERLPWHDPSAKISKSNFDWNGSFKENKANFLPTESSDQQGYHDLSEVDRNASNDMRYANTGNGGLFALDPSNKEMYFQTVANNNNQSTSSILREENASKESNMELSQLIESVMNHLGNKASNVVATELAKYPMFKDMWATAIAHALVKQSSHLLRNGSSKKVKEVSQLSPPKTSSLLEKQSKQLTVGTKLPKTQVNSGRMVALINGGVKNSHSTLRLSKDRPFAVKIQSESLSSSIKGRRKANEDNLQHNQKMRKEPFYNKAPSKSHPQKTRKKPFLTEGEANLLENHLVAGNKHVISPPMRELISSKKPVNPETNIPFLFDRFTTLDPGESKYVQLNLMNDPIAKEEFSQADSVASYPNQQQQERQDEQEAKFVEHQINRGYQSSGRAQQNLNMAMTRENSGEAKFVAGQVLADPFTKEELAESLTPENKIINEENRQNAQIMAAILNDDDKKVSESYQEGNLPKSNELHFQDEKSYEEQESPLRQGAQTESSSPTEQFENLDKPSDLENVPKTDKLKVKDAAKLAAELESKMLLNSKVVSDISAIDVAPMRRLQALQGSYDVNKARNFMHASDAENEISDHMTRQMDPYLSTQYGMDRFHGNKRQSHKKNDIQMKRPDDSQTQARRHRTFASTLSSAEKVLKSSLDLTSTNQSINTEVPLKKLEVSRQGKDQSGSKSDEIEQQLTRESDISPTSVIFGLTSKEMKELGRHMLRKPHGAPALSGKTAETDHIQELLPAAKGYYDEYTEMEQPKETLALLVKKLKKRKIKTKASVVSGHRVHKTSNKLLHHRNSVPISKKRELKYHQQKKINSQKKRDLGTWEGSWRPSFDTSTQVLNSDLDQLRGLSPRAQEDISKTILRDDNGEARSSNQIGPHYPIYGNDEFQRSITQSNGNYEDRTFGKPKESDGHTYIRRTKLPTQPSQRRRKVVNNDTYKKDEFSLIIDLNTTKPKDSEPLLIKGNKILNGDVSLLDEVKNLDAHDEILKTLRQESEGDLSYVNTLQNHDLNRIKNLFRSAGNEVGTKRFTQIHPPTGVAHLQTNKNLNRRNLIGDAREIRDDNKAFSGTADALDAFQNPEVQTQLLHDLHDENINTLSYVDALQDADKHRLKMLHREADQFGTDWTGEESPHQVFRNGEKTRKSDSETETFKNSQKKLREFLKHIRKIKVVKNGKNAKHDKTQRGAVRELKYDVFPKFSPEGNILSTDYKELGSFTGDDQTELASILRSENKGDQKDLNNFEKMDEDDERDVDLLFSTFSGPSKRSTDEKATKKRDDLIETIADVSDPESKEKEISVVVSGEDAQPQFGEEAKKVEEPRPSEWSSWSRCSTSCGEGSIKTRSKYCDENSTSDAIVKCPGWNHQSIPCNVSHHCPVDGGFTQWTDWSECSESCGPKAVHMRMRLCTNPPPSYGGKDCSGWRFQVEYCKSKECPHKQGTSGTTDQHVAKMKAQNKNNRIIFKTLSATPLIEEISSNIPTDAVDRSRERTISRFSDLRHYVQDLDNGQPSQIESDVPELQRIPDIQRVFNVEQLQIPSMQQLSSAPQIQTTSHLHSMQQFESEPQISTSSHLQSVQQLSDTPQIQSQSHLNSVQQLDSEAQMPTVPHLQNVQQLSSSPEIESTSNLHTMHQLDSESQIPTASHLRNMQQLSGTPDIETGSHLHTMHQLDSEPPMPTTSHLQNMQQLSSAPQIDTISHLHSVQQLSRAPQIPTASHLHGMQQPSQRMGSMSSMSFLKPDMTSMSQNEQETFENGMKTIHLRAKSEGIGFTPWNMWSTCTVTCGRGMRTRTRTCIGSFEATGIDNSCLGPRVQTKACRRRRCPIKVLSLDDGNCCLSVLSTLELRGYCYRWKGLPKQRTCQYDLGCWQKSITQKSRTGVECRPCVYAREVYVDGQFTPWSDWSECSKSCGPDSYRKRERTCTDPPPRYGGEECEGRSVQRRHCLKAPCPPNNNTTWNITRVFVQAEPEKNASANFVGGFTEWGPWSQCSKTCGSDSLRVRKRSCYNPFPFGGQNCNGSTTEVKPCLLPPCLDSFDEFLPYSQKLGPAAAVNISVKNEFDWSPWSPCTETCGPNSYRTRERTCSLAFTENNGRVCIGADIQKIPCDVPLCETEPSFAMQQENAFGQNKNLLGTSAFSALPAATVADMFLTPQVGLSASSLSEIVTSPSQQDKAVRSPPAAPARPVPLPVNMVPGTQATPSILVTATDPVSPSAKAAPGTQAASSASVTPADPVSPSAKAAPGTQGATSVPVTAADPVSPSAKAAPGTQGATSVPVTAADPVSPSAKAAPGTQGATSVSVTAADPVSPSAKAAPGTQGATSVLVTPADPVSPSAKAAPGTQGATSVPVTAADPVSPSAKAAPGTQGATSVSVTAADPVSPPAKAAPGTQGATSVSVTAADPVPPPAKAAPGTQAAPSPSATAAEPVSPPAKAAPGTPAVSSASLNPADPVSQPAKMAPGTQASLSASANQVDSVSPPAKAAFGNQTLPSLSAAPVVPVSPLGKEAPETQSIAFATKSAASPVPSSVAAGSTGSQATTLAKPVPGTQITPIMPSSPSKRLAPLPKLPPPNPNFSDWSRWSKCSATCGPKAVMYRERTCKLRGGRKCQGPNIQTKPCPLVRCPVHGGFSQWSQWTHCPVTCGTMALARRQRTCTNPKPMLGGRECEGERMQIKNCGREICPVNGGLTGWTEWSSCTKTCNTNAVSIRERYCTNPPPRGRGRDCMGQRMQAKACASLQCPVDGGYTAWSEWSECPRCIRGTRKRLRSCTNPPPTNGGKPCVEPAIEEEDCPFVRCKTSLGFGQWSSFGKCSRSCGGGIKRRRRRCRRPWRGCYGPRVQRRRCNRHSCPNENFLVRADPVELCGFNPCKVAKCALDQSAMCVSNSKCKPVFFNTDGKIIESCRGDSILLAAPPEQVCQFNPCKNSACYTSTAERCVVSYKCKPIFYGGDGRPINCRGILTVPAKDVCGFDPCFEKACKVDLTARCVSDAECKPTFISKTERILDECVEDSSDDDSNDEDEETEHTKKLEPEDRNEDSNNEENEGEESDAEADSKKYDENDDDDDEKDEDIKRKRKKHRKDDEDLESDDEEEDDEKPRRHRKKFRNDDDDDDADDNEDDRDNGESKKKDITPFVHLNVTSSRDRMVSGMGSEISFVSKNGPAKFYWLRRGDKGSKNSTQMLVIEAKGSKKSAVLNAKQSNKTGNPR